MNMLSRALRSTALAAVVLMTGAQTALADLVGGAEYLIGRDRLGTIASGTYGGLANPNFGRLTMLFNHGNHYHGIGAYSYTGTPPDHTVLSTNSNNRIPETYTGLPPLSLVPGSGPLYADKLVNHPDPTVEYTSITFRSVDSLAGYAPGSEESILYNSSNGRWSSSLAGTKIAIELVSITSGLTVGDASTLNLFESSNRYALGAGDLIDFTPVFWVAAGAAMQTYSAEFRFLDLGVNGAVLSAGGTFNFDFAPTPVPLPAAAWMLLSGALALVGARRRQA